MPVRMMNPPMVGVPALVSTWLSGPSSRMGWEPCFLSQPMKGMPTTSATTKAVISAAPVRKVR